VGEIEVIKGLPFGLTEQAIKAARMVMFLPTVKEGRFVTERTKIEFNFDIY